MCLHSCVCRRAAPSQKKMPTTSLGHAALQAAIHMWPITEKKMPLFRVAVYGSLFFSTLHSLHRFSPPPPTPLPLSCSSTASHLPLLPRCVFLPDNGAFFVNYVITAALLGTGMELMRLGSLCTYCTRLFFSRSEPERVHIRKVRAGPSLSTTLGFWWEGKGGVCLPGALGPTMRGL